MTTARVPVLQCDLCGTCIPEALVGPREWISDRARDLDYCPACAPHADAAGLVEVVDSK